MSCTKEAKEALDKIFKDVQDLETEVARLKIEREHLRSELATAQVELAKWRATRRGQ
jgi:outer membrane murein-binding lipoprotein Lpp